jgi:hypothetical protein
MSYVGPQPLSPMWDGSNAPELHRPPVPEDGPWPSERKQDRPPEVERQMCPYCEKLLYPPGNPDKQHACKQTVHMLYMPGTVVTVKKDTWALILETTQQGVIRYQQITPMLATFQEEPIEDFHETVTGEQVTA